MLFLDFQITTFEQVNLTGLLSSLQPMEVFVDDETKLTLHGLQQYYSKLKDSEKNRKLFDLLDALEFNQVNYWTSMRTTINLKTLGINCCDV